MITTIKTGSPAPTIIGARTEGQGWRRYYLVSSTYHVILRLESGILPDSWIYASAGTPIARDWGDATPAEIVAWYVRIYGPYGCVEAPGPEIDWALDLLRRKAPEVAQLLTGVAQAPIAVGQIRTVFGHGLMQVRSVDGTGPVEMLGHSWAVDKLPEGKVGHWFTSDRIGDIATPEVVRREFEQARARNLACNSPDCWCRPYTTQGGSS